MLVELTSEKLIKLKIKASNWEDAIRQAAAPLVDEGKVKLDYIDDMIRGVNENGPYIVITKHVALPHARPESGALENAIGIATLQDPIEFGSEANDPVRYMFCLSATDNMGHLNALAELAELLENKEFFAMLDKATSAKEILDYLKNK